MTAADEPVLSFGTWRTNAQLIADVARLGYVGPSVLDLSYGLGAFWTDWRPDKLVANDLNPDKGDHSIDVTGDPPDEWLERFDTTVWDGPYRMCGTPGHHQYSDRYGIDRYLSIPERLDLLRAGVTFAAACTVDGGTVLVKCQDQVSSKRKIWQTITLVDHAAERGLRFVDRFDLTSPRRAQPSGRQEHSRSNTSQLLVFERCEP